MVHLGEICIIEAGNPAPQGASFFKEGKYPFVRVKDLGELKGQVFISKTKDFLNEKGINKMKLVPKGSILFTKSGMSILLNQRAILKRDMYVVSHIGYAIPLGNIPSEWIYYWLTIIDFKDLTHATTLPSLQLSKVKDIFIPLPPLPEQHRIIEKIEELFTKLDAGVAVLEKVRAQLKRYRQAVLKAAFSGQLTAEWRQKCVGAGSSRPLEASKTSDSDEGATTTPFGGQTNLIRQDRRIVCDAAPLQNSNLPDLPDGWEWQNGKNIFDFITSGSRGWAKYYSDTGPIFLRMGNLDHNSISLDLRNIQHVQLPKGIEGIRTKVEANDILISITADVGMIALIPENFDEAYINQHIALCRPNKEVFQKYVAWYLVCHEGGLKQFQNMRRGATKIGLGLDDIRMINIPISENKEQQQIVSEIESRFSVADEVEKTVENALKQAKRLRQSILKMAFEGKLVPQDPNDEPAETLLERIKAEKELHKKKKRMI